MQAQSMAIPVALPDSMFVAEVIRTAAVFTLLVGLIVAYAFAMRHFAGPRARVAPRWHHYFTAIGVASLITLAVARNPIEGFLAFLAEPLNRLTERTMPGWPSEVAVGLFRSAMTTLFAVIVIQAVGRLYWRWEGRLRRWQEGREATRAQITLVGRMLLRLLRAASITGLLLATVPLYLSYFPRSRHLMERMEGYLADPARAIVAAIIGYLPDLAYLIIILIIARYCLRGIRYLFDSLENGTLTIPGFHPDWALPTYRLSRTLFLFFILMVSYPYLPGSKSQFFQGFSVFVGALITFGSSGAIGNMVAGTLLTYTRAFRVGDMVTIADHTGVVITKSLLVTRLRTPKNEEVSIPNGNVLSTSVLNYSARAAAEGVVLTVSAGIGYDVDWRTVHKLMIEGALATDHILKDPPPVVWQSALADYAVNYELRACTSETDLMWETHSMLRQNVLDAFNRAGVEIMTPSILAHRDASGLAVPVEQFPTRKAPAGIAVDVKPRT